MASISAPELAQTILDECLTYGTWPTRELDALIIRALDETDEFSARAATRAFFRIIVERLADLFEPALCEIYANIFAHAISQALPEFQREELLLRYHRIRQVRKFQGGEVNRVFVLSRITLGADVAVTSVVLAACKKRFPNAEICFVGPGKNAEMFGADSSITPITLNYGRGSVLRDRLLAALELQAIVDELGGIVVDPDSRLTQLGLIPVCDDAKYYFFESRAYGGESHLSLTALTQQWVGEVFDVDDLRPYTAPPPQARIADVTVSWGVGENEDKRLGSDFETYITSQLLAQGRTVLLDQGAGGAEAENAKRVAEELGHPERLYLHEGSYASFAAHINVSKLYVGYDSAGQHVASAADRPLVSLFAGAPCPRMLSRWAPTGARAWVVDVDDTHERVATRTLQAIEAAWAAGARGALAAPRD